MIVQNENYTQYFGIDAEEFLKKTGFEREIEFLGKECTLYDQKGIIIGIEDNISLSDYYYIVYIPSTKKTKYALLNKNI